MVTDTILITVGLVIVSFVLGYLYGEKVTADNYLGKFKKYIRITDIRKHVSNIDIEE